MMRKTIAGLSVLYILLTLPGCGSGAMNKSFMREGATLSHIETVVVLPFENTGGSAGAVHRTREFTMIQLLSAGNFDVVDRGRVDSVLRDEVIDPGAPLDAPTLRRLGQRLGAQGFVLGSVEHGTGTRGNAVYPEVNLSLRLLDAETGILIWQATGQGSGYSVMDRLFGFAPKNSFDVTLELLDRLLATMRTQAP